MHPRLALPERTIRARYFGMPNGWVAGASPDADVHPGAPRRWRSIGAGGFRIPDALATTGDGIQVLLELKCPSGYRIRSRVG